MLGPFTRLRSRMVTEDHAADRGDEEHDRGDLECKEVVGGYCKENICGR